MEPKFKSVKLTYIYVCLLFYAILEICQVFVVSKQQGGKGKIIF